jgi:hypothetical protein
MTSEPAPEIPRLPVNRGGRKSKFTKPLVRRILKAVGRGMPIQQAANACGVSPSTLLTYRRRYPAFDQKVQEAIAKGIAARLDVVILSMKSAEESIRLRASTWWLEHVVPEHFGRNRIEVTGTDGSPLAAIAIYLPQKDNSRPAVEVTPAKQIQNHERA